MVQVPATILRLLEEWPQRRVWIQLTELPELQDGLTGSTCDTEVELVEAVQQVSSLDRPALPDQIAQLPQPAISE